MSELNKFIGSGLTFPIELNTLSKTPIVYADLKLIRSSIANILNWPQRMRYFNEQYGCRIEEILEEPDNSVSRTLARDFIRDALNRWEKRIRVKEVKILESPYQGRMDISINYEIRNTKIEETIIYPFYTELIY